MKNSNDTIGNRTRALPACSAVPQPTAPPRAPLLLVPSLTMIRAMVVLPLYDYLISTGNSYNSYKNDQQDATV